jgi:hypothetical protein
MWKGRPDVRDQQAGTTVWTGQSTQCGKAKTEEIDASGCLMCQLDTKEA